MVIEQVRRWAGPVEGCQLSDKPQRQRRQPAASTWTYPTKCQMTIKLVGGPVALGTGPAQSTVPSVSSRPQSAQINSRAIQLPPLTSATGLTEKRRLSCQTNRLRQLLVLLPTDASMQQPSTTHHPRPRVYTAATETCLFLQTSIATCLTGVQPVLLSSKPGINGKV